MRRNFKKLTAVALTAAMTMGSAMTVFAAPTSGDVSGDISSEGEYEGGEMQYPEISVTLPTVPSGTSIDYIADPYDLIQNTMDASGNTINTNYADSEFTSTTGIYFKTSAKSGDVKAQYTEKSAPLVLTNENAQNLKVKVKVEQTAAISGDALAYSQSPEFSGDAKEMYFAITDGTTEEAVDTTGVAEFEAEIKGTPDNFEPKYNGGKYAYEKKAGADGWASATYQLTGAINKNAKWNDNITFPAVKLTWSWEAGEVEKDSSPSVADVTYSAASASALVISCKLGAGPSKATAVTDIALTGSDGKLYTAHGAWGCPTTNLLTVAGSTATISESWMSATQPGTYTGYIIFDNNEDASVPFSITVTP